MKKKAYVVGNNTHKSLSPTIFNYWFEKHKINGEYNYIEIKEENFEKEITQILKTKDLCGLNITIPYKEKIIPLISDVDNHSKLIGAVNCVSKINSVVEGINTDWFGFKESMLWFEKNKLEKIKTKKETAIVVGYGGSARAIIYALKKMQYKNIKVFNRTFSKIEKTKDLQTYDLNDLTNHIKRADLIVNTIPKKNFYSKNLKKISKHGNCEQSNFGYDLVYTTETNFLNLFNPLNRISGIHLLIHQAAPCFEKWFGLKPKIDNDLFNLLYNKLKKLK